MVVTWGPPKALQESGNLRFGCLHIFLLHLSSCDASLGKPFQGKAKTRKRLCLSYGLYGYLFETRLAGKYPGPMLLCE